MQIFPQEICKYQIIFVPLQPKRDNSNKHMRTLSDSEREFLMADMKSFDTSEFECENAQMFADDELTEELIAKGAATKR